MTDAMRRITRRSLGALLAGTAVWLGVRPAFARTPAQRLLSLLREQPLALGALCVKALPGEDADKLTAALMRGCGTDGSSRSAIAANIRDDFAQGRIVDADGWQLSLTEARLCALAALSSRMA